MNPLARFERLAVRIFEEDLPRLLGGRLDPSEMVHAIERAIDDLPAGSPRPPVLQLTLAVDDFRALQSRHEAIAHELERRIEQPVRERWPGKRSPSVTLAPSHQQARHTVRAEALFEPSAPPTIVTPPVSYRPVEIQAASLGVGARIWNGATAVVVPRVPFGIGRALDNDLVVDGPSISRYHAQLRGSEAGLTIVDLESTNGTSVNGRPVMGSAPLSDGDAILLGTYPLRITAR